MKIPISKFPKSRERKSFLKNIVPHHISEATLKLPDFGVNANQVMVHVKPIVLPVHWKVGKSEMSSSSGRSESLKQRRQPRRGVLTSFGEYTGFLRIPRGLLRYSYGRTINLFLFSSILWNCC